MVSLTGFEPACARLEAGVPSNWQQGRKIKSRSVGCVLELTSGPFLLNISDTCGPGHLVLPLGIDPSFSD